MQLLLPEQIDEWTIHEIEPLRLIDYDTQTPERSWTMQTNGIPLLRADLLSYGRKPRPSIRFLIKIHQFDRIDGGLHCHPQWKPIGVAWLKYVNPAELVASLSSSLGEKSSRFREMLDRLATIGSYLGPVEGVGMVRHLNTINISFSDGDLRLNINTEEETSSIFEQWQTFHQDLGGAWDAFYRKKMSARPTDALQIETAKTRFLESVQAMAYNDLPWRMAIERILSS